MVLSPYGQTVRIHGCDAISKSKLQLGSQGVLYMKAVVKDATLHGEMGFAKGQGRNQGRQAAASRCKTF
jgi:hypothetical protein